MPSFYVPVAVTTRALVKVEVPDEGSVDMQACVAGAAARRHAQALEAVAAASLEGRGHIVEGSTSLVGTGRPADA